MRAGGSHLKMNKDTKMGRPTLSDSKIVEMDLQLSEENASEKRNGKVQRVAKTWGDVG